MIKDKLAALASVGDDGVLLANQKESSAADKAKVERPLRVSEEKSADAKRRIADTEHNENTLDKLATKAKDVQTKSAV